MLVDVNRTRGLRLAQLLVLLLVNQKRLQVDFNGDTRLLLYRNVLYFFNILVLGIAGRDFRLLLLIIKSELILLIIVSDDISILQPC
jgi:hypothetical protein